MQILLQHADMDPPESDEPGLFALGDSGALEEVFTESGLVNYEERTLNTQIQLSSAEEFLTMLQEAAPPFRSVINKCPEDVRQAAWNEVSDFLKRFEADDKFESPAEVRIGAAERRD